MLVVFCWSWVLVGFLLVCGCGMDGSLGVVVVAGEVAGVAAVLLLFLLLVRLRTAALVVCGRGREGVGLLLGAFVVVWCALGYVRVVWWRAFVVESVLRSLLCGVVGVPS